jgi:hypothetical protein
MDSNFQQEHDGVNDQMSCVLLDLVFYVASSHENIFYHGPTFKYS